MACDEFGKNFHGLVVAAIHLQRRRGPKSLVIDAHGVQLLRISANT